MRDDETLERTELERLQRRKLATLLDALRADNPFYQCKLDRLEFDAARDPIERLPLTTRREIQQDQIDNPPHGTNLTAPLDQYVRQHQTSGSSGQPLRWLDTPKGWKWFQDCWADVFAAAGVTRADRLFFPFSFGPFVGFWAAFESAAGLGNFVLPAGGMSTGARLRYLLENDVTVVCCTPTYALHLSQTAAAEGLDLPGSRVWAVIVGGEPGASIPALRARLEAGWGARLFDHAGMTEIGAWGLECREAPGGMHVNEAEFIAELIDPATGQAVAEGQAGELVLTNLGRPDSPLIRYRTGDQVRLTHQPCPCGRCFAWAAGGVLGRLDDMIIIRGNNVFPSAIEGILREFREVAEFRIEVDRRAALADLSIEIEPDPDASLGGLAERIVAAIRDRLHFRPNVRLAEAGSLPRFELKARRVVYRDRDGS